MPSSFAQTLSQAGSGWLVFTLYMTLFLLFFDFAQVIHFRFKFDFLFSLFLTLCLLAYGNYHYQHPCVKVINIVFNKPIQSYQQSLKIVAISDLHLGYATNKETLSEYVNQINNLRPDIVLIGGDLIDNSIVPLEREHMENELSLIKAPLGIFMIPGNHEYISGIERTKSFINKTPIHWLQDTVVTLPNQLQLIGRDDRHNKKRKNLSQLTKNLNKERPVILLDHQPYNLNKTAKANIDLQFSGHTHRGQIWPISWIVDHVFEISYGLRKIGNSTIYVSSGLSLWGPPYRIGTDSEIVVFNIKCKEQK